MVNLLVAARALIEEGRLGALATVVAGPGIGSHALFDREGVMVAGDLPPPLAREVAVDAVALVDAEASRIVERGGSRVFVETVAPPPRLLLFGAGDLAEAVSAAAAVAGFRVTVCDPRPAFATRDRFPQADEVLVGWPAEALPHIRLDERTYVVVVAHDVRVEDPLFPVLLASPVPYIGALGNRRTHAARVERLAAAGWGEEQTGRIRGPIGLDIGARTPGEIAVAIVAEVVAVRWGAAAGGR